MRWRTRRAQDGGDAHRSALLAVLAGDGAAAEEHLAAALARDAGDVDAFLAIGRLFRQRGEIGRALRVHQNLLLRSDLSAEQRQLARADLAEDYRAGGFAPQARARYEEVLAADPRHRGALRGLVELLAEAGEQPRALKLARRLARLEGRSSADAEAELGLGLARRAFDEGRSAEARRAARRALRRQPDRADGWLLLGEIEAERGRKRAVLAACARAAELDPEAALLRLEAAYQSLDRGRDFESWLRSRLEARPGDAAARRALARTLLARGEGAAATEELRGLLAEHPGDLGARAALGRLLLAEQRDAEALEEYTRLLDAIEPREGGP